MQEQSRAEQHGDDPLSGPGRNGDNVFVTSRSTDFGTIISSILNR